LYVKQSSMRPEAYRAAASRFSRWSRKSPVFCPLKQVGLEPDAAFDDLDPLRDVAVNHLDALLEPLEQADLRVVPRQDASRRAEVDERGDHLRHQAVGALRERLHHQAVAVAVDDERGQEGRRRR